MRKLLTLQLLLTLGLNLSAQEFHARKFTVRDGLPQSQVTCMTQHPDGHIWVGTKDGIARFDGKAFKAYRSESIRGELRGLHFLNDSIMAMRYTNGSILLFNTKRWNSTKIASSLPVSGLRPSPLKRDVNDTYYMLGRALGQNPKKRIPHSIWQLTDTGYTKTPAFDGFLRSLQQDRFWGWNLCPFTDTHWFSSQFGDLIAFRKGKREQFEASETDELIALGWFHSSTDTLYQLSFKDHILYRMMEKPVPVDTLPELLTSTPYRNPIAMDSKGVIYALQESSKLYALFPGDEVWTFINTFNYATLFVDRDDNLYVADEGALYVYSNFAFSHFTPKEDGIPRYIWTVLDDNDGNTWLGSYGHGLWKWKDGQFIDLTDSYINDHGNHALREVYMGGIRDHQNSLLFGTNGQLFFFKNKTEKPRVIERHGTANLICWQDEETKLIYSGTTEGVDVIDTNYQVIQQLRDSVHLPMTIVSIEKDANGNHWFGGFKNLTKYDGKTFTSRFTDERGKTVSAICMERDSSGTLWVGGMDGLRYLKGGKFFPVESGPFTGTIGSLCTIGKDCMLVSLMDGIALFRMKDYLAGKRDFYSYYGPSEGFIGIEPGQNGFHRRADGTVWVPTTDRLTLIHPERLPTNTEAPKLFVDGLTVTWKDSVYHLQASEQEGGYRFSEKIPYGAERLRLQFHAVNYSSPEEVVYNFRSDDGPWSEPQEDRHIDFTELGHGAHSVTIRAWLQNQPVPEDVSEMQVSFCVTTPFYLTWWFLVGSIGLSIFTVSCITVLIGRQRRRKVELQHRLDMELNDLQYKALKTQVEPHFAANLLNSVNAAILREDKKKASRILGSFSKMIRDILRQNDRRVHSLKEELELVERYVELEKYILGEKLDYRTEISEDVNLERPVPVMLIHTFVENAIKHAIRINPNGGTILVKITRSEKGKTISISDTGKGDDPNVHHHQSTRKGISLIDNIVQIYNRYNQLNMTVDVSDGQNGRTVLVFIPHGFKFETPISSTP